MEAGLSKARSKLALVISAILAIAMGAAAPVAVAGTWTFAEQELVFNGPIEPGDAEALARLLAEIAVKHSPAVVSLNSPGGSVVEAQRMASLVEAFRLDATVPANGTCASACFVVYLGGALRVTYDGSKGDRKGRVGLHRPFFKQSQNASAEQSVGPAQMRDIMSKMRTYLSERNVPQRLIDEMMSRPSNDIYWLTLRDQIDLRMSPDREELEVVNCGYRRVSMDDAPREQRSLQEELQEWKRQRDCSRATTDRLQNEERPALLAKLNAGWRPWRQ